MPPTHLIASGAVYFRQSLKPEFTTRKSIDEHLINVCGARFYLPRSVFVTYFLGYLFARQSVFIPLFNLATPDNHSVYMFHLSAVLSLLQNLNILRLSHKKIEMSSHA